MDTRELKYKDYRLWSSPASRKRRDGVKKKIDTRGLTFSAIEPEDPMDYKFASGSTTPSYSQFMRDYAKSLGWGDIDSEFLRVSSDIRNPDRDKELAELGQKSKEIAEEYKKRYGSGNKLRSDISFLTGPVLPTVSKLANPERPKVEWYDPLFDISTVAGFGTGAAAGAAGKAAVSLGKTAAQSARIAKGTQLAGRGVEIGSALTPTVAEWDNLSPGQKAFGIGASALGAGVMGLENKAAIQKGVRAGWKGTEAALDRTIETGRRLKSGELNPQAGSMTPDAFIPKKNVKDLGNTTSKDYNSTNMADESTGTPYDSQGKVEATEFTAPEEPILNVKEYQGKVGVRKLWNLMTTPEGRAKLRANAVKRIEAKKAKYGSYAESMDALMAQGFTRIEAMDESRHLLSGELPKDNVVKDLIPEGIRADVEAMYLDNLAEAGYSGVEFEGARTAFKRFVEDGAIPVGGTGLRSSTRTYLEKGLGKDFVKLAEDVAADPVVKTKSGLQGAFDFGGGGTAPDLNLGTTPGKPAWKAKKPVEDLDLQDFKTRLDKTKSNYTYSKDIDWKGKHQNFEYQPGLGEVQGKIEYPIPLGKNINNVGFGTAPKQSTLDLGASALEGAPDVGGKLNLSGKPAKKPVNWKNRIAGEVLELANIPRGLMASFDLSAPLRQSLTSTLAHPIKASRAFTDMIRVLKSEEELNKLDDILHGRYIPKPGEANPNRFWTPMGKRYGLYIADMKKGATVTLGAREEAFASKWLQKIPGVRHSERAYMAYNNNMRSLLWEDACENLKKLGATEGDYKAMASVINYGTGRGKPPTITAGVAPVLNAVLFSPRLILSRFQLPAQMLNFGHREAQKEAIRQFVSLLGFGSAAVATYGLVGGKVELDPRSAEFGKLRIGDTRIDVWGGYLQYVRLIAQLGTGETKTTSGNVKPLNSIDALARSLQSKGSPIISLILDSMRGEDYMGEKMEFNADQIRNRLAPLVAQGIYEAYMQGGAKEAVAATVGFVGIGTTTYTNPVAKMQEEVAQSQAGKSWSELNSAEQLKLRQMNPALRDLTEKENEQYSQSIAGKADVNNRYRLQMKAIESQYGKEIDQATRKYRATGDGYIYRQEVSAAADNRRSSYSALSENPEFDEVQAKMNMDLTPEKAARMQDEDILRVTYNKLMYGDSMYDQFGDYMFEEAERRKQEFVKNFGQEALDYIKDYQGIKEEALPVEFKELQEARKVLKPYWEIENKVWAGYDSKLKLLSAQAEKLRESPNLKDRREALKILRANPGILRARQIIARQKLQLKRQSPLVKELLAKYYS